MKREFPIEIELEPEEFNALERLAKFWNISRDQVVRRAVEMYLEVHQPRPRSGPGKRDQDA